MTAFSKHRSPGRRALVATTAVAVTGLTVGVGLSLAGTPAASAAPLPAFGGCDELLDWYVDRALPAVGPYGLGGGPIAYGAVEDTVGSGWAADGSAPQAVAGEARVTSEVSSDQGRTASGTGTNVQETGVDEPDLAKTDGEVIVRVVGDQLRVSRIGDGQVGDVDETGVLGLPDDLQASELLLSGSRVLVIGSASSVDPGPVPLPGPAIDVVPAPDGSEPSVLESSVGRSFPIAPYSPVDSSRVVEVDLTDPGSPRIRSDRTYGGSLVSARQYDPASGGSVVRLVLHTGTPTLDFVQPNRDRSEREATEENRRIVRDSSLDDWLPRVRDAAGDSSQLLACDDVRHPVTRDLPSPDRAFPDLGTLSIVTLPFNDPTETTATAVTTSAQTVYSSTDRLYVALGGPDGSTQVHAFSVAGDDTRYTASGSVKGMVRDRWSMDEQDGVLRLAVGYGGWSASDNGIVTLREDGDRLAVLGSVRGLGPDEEIKSVRWFDDLAVVVTFRQTDPLYTVDLTVPADPRTLGALKIPGFSTYLHPLGGGRLLGIGQDASLQGMVLGAQASVFDISDLRDPRRLSRLSLDGKSLLAEYDPRALTWLPESDVVLAGATDEADGRAAMLELRVREDGSLVRGRAWPLDSAYDGGQTVSPRALPLGEGRVALVGVGVRIVQVS